MCAGVRHGGLVGAANPVAHLDAHRGLGEVLALERESVAVVQGAHEVAVDVPLDVGRCPVDGVGVPGTDGVGDVVVDGTVVAGGVALAEEVALDRGVGASQPLPVNLIEVVGLEDEAADDAGPGGGLGGDGDLAEEDILGGADGGRVGGSVDDEVGAVASVGHLGCVG